MGLILTFLLTPSPTLGHGADDRLAAGFDRYTLDPNHLTALAAVAAERFEQGGVGPRQLAGGAHLDLPHLEALLRQHRPAVTLHGGTVAGDHLSQQAIWGILGSNRKDQNMRLSTFRKPPTRRIALALAAAANLAV